MNTDRLTSTDLQAFLDRCAVGGEILHLAAPTLTVESAAQVVGVRPEQIVKSILFLVEGQPVLAIANGTARVHYRTVAAHFHLSRKRLRLATPAEVLALAGYEVGSMPPFGHRQPLPTLLDPHVLEWDEVYAGGGDENALVRLDPQVILKISGATLLNLQADPNGEAEAA